MGLFDLISNTTEGVIQTTAGVAKTIIGTATLPFDEGRTFEDGVDTTDKGLEKIGKSDDG